MALRDEVKNKRGAKSSSLRASRKPNRKAMPKPHPGDLAKEDDRGSLPPPPLTNHSKFKYLKRFANIPSLRNKQGQ